MHISSLPSPYGIGTMGKSAYEFADFLHEAGQSIWQILPICPTSFGDSPYQSFSSYAGNPYFIDLDLLTGDGLLRKSEFSHLVWSSAEDSIDYGLLYRQRYPILRLAVARLLKNPPRNYANFCRSNAHWLEDYALFMALKNCHGGDSWQLWDKPYRLRETNALAVFFSEHSDEIAFWQAVQYLFFRQWGKLKSYVNQLGISIVGDLPIYVAEDSAEVWAHPEQFQLDADLHPLEVAGCPPDAFSADGQLWGNPLFDWERMEQDNFAWWRERVAYQKSIYDILRIDHFRGLAGYYAIPGGSKTARDGRWRKGPDSKLLDALKCSVGLGNIIAEDLGFLDDDVRNLLADSGLPGMKVLEFAFDSREDSDYLPHNYNHHCVVYTGTHDNDTVIGWMRSAPEADVAKATEYLRLTDTEGLNWGLMRGVWSSVGDLAVVQMQDILGLGSEARMNVPSTVGTNWRWRMLPGTLNSTLAKKLSHQMELYQRLPKKDAASR